MAAQHVFLSDPVGNPEDRFSHVAAQIVYVCSRRPSSVRRTWQSVARVEISDQQSKIVYCFGFLRLVFFWFF